MDSKQNFCHIFTCVKHLINEAHVYANHNNNSSNIELNSKFFFVEMRLSKHFYQYSVLMCYAYGALWAVPPLFGWGSYSVEPFGTACSIGRVFLNW